MAMTKEKLAEIRERMQWVSVDDRLPEKDETILVWVGTMCTRACVGKTPYGPAWYLIDKNCYLNWWSVTHWMPLPEPPKVNNN